MPTAVRSFFDPGTSTFTHVAHDTATGKAAIVDAVLDYCASSGRTSTVNADAVVAYLADNNLQVQWLLETHAHADHLSAGMLLRERCGGRLAVGVGIREVQSAFKPVFNYGDGFATDGSQFDHLFQDGEAFSVGSVQARVLATPGHTSDSVSYIIGDAVFIGDTLFSPAYGSARCDFPGGDASTLFDSVQKLYALDPEQWLYLCHDYPASGVEPRARVRVSEQATSNVHLKRDTPRDEFVAMRTKRDASLSMPALILPSVQVNIRAGALPEASANGIRYLRIPLNTL